jgi:excisionase family DNA binding protein
MNGRKNVLTTGEVARICNVAPRTVSKWFDAGHLRGYRIPGSKDRRIPLSQLIRFMRAHGIPLNGLETGNRRILLLDADTESAARLRERIPTYGAWELAWANTPFEAGVMFSDVRPHILLVDIGSLGSSPRKLASVIRATSDLRQTCLVATGQGLTDGEGQELLQKGFDAYLAKPFDIRGLLDVLESALGVRQESENAEEPESMDLSAAHSGP